MSGILKRKLEADPAAYLSLRGSDDDDVSCSDSGNSSDSLNHPVAPEPHAASASTSLHQQQLQQRAKRRRGRSVHFEGVTVYYFGRRQGFTSVPTQGGSTLGMSPRHSWARRFTLGEFALEQERSHRTLLRKHLKEEKLHNIRLRLTRNGTVSSVEAAAMTLDDVSEDDLDVDNTEVDEYFFLQPLTTRRRRALLRTAGVRRIDVQEKHELRALRGSREECGCSCRGACNPQTCACSLAGIKCQVDRTSFPCGCTKDSCGNAAGRLEFNPVRVRTHFLHTIMKLELEKSREHQQQQQQQQHHPPPHPHSPPHPHPHPHQQQQRQQLVTNGNGYHGDSPLVQIQQQQQPNLPFPLMNGTASLPIMHLHNTSDTDSQLDEDEDEDEEEEDEEEEDEDDEEEEDEAFDDDDDDDDEDEDGSSLCSGLMDCSTHSLETIDPEEDEDEEGDEEDEDDEDDDEGDTGDNADDWESSLDSVGPSPFSHTEVLPLSPVLGFPGSSTHFDLRGDPFRPLPKAGAAPSVAARTEPQTQTNRDGGTAPAAETSPPADAHCQTPDMSDSPAPEFCPPSAATGDGIKPIGKTDKPNCELQNDLNADDSKSDNAEIREEQ